MCGRQSLQSLRNNPPPQVQALLAHQLQRRHLGMLDLGIDRLGCRWPDVHKMPSTVQIFRCGERVCESLALMSILPADGTFCTVARFKWKPPQQISVDFFLEFRFPPICDLPDRPDLLATPLFILKVRRKRELLYFDTMRMQDDEWKRYSSTPLIIKEDTEIIDGNSRASNSIIVSLRLHGMRRTRTGRSCASGTIRMSQMLCLRRQPHC